MLHDINNLITVNDIVAVTRLGNKTKGYRPTLVKFICHQKNSSVFKKLDKVREKKISVADDLSREDRDARKPLQQYFHALKARGLALKIRNECILIKGKLYKAEQIAAYLESTVTGSSTNQQVNEGGINDVQQYSEDDPVTALQLAVSQNAVQTLSQPYAISNTPFTPRGSKRPATSKHGNDISKYFKADKEENVLISMEEIRLAEHVTPPL